MSADRPDFIDPSALEPSAGLYVVGTEENSVFPQNVTSIEPYLANRSQTAREYHKPPTNALVLVSKSGMELGEHELYTDPQNTIHTTDILYSEMYDLRASTVTGNVTGYFFQYTRGYSGDEYGALHPHTAPHKELRKYTDYDDRGNEIVHWWEDHPSRLAWTGNETKRVLTVTYDSETGEVTRGYIKGKDLRYALADKERLERARAALQRIKEGQPSMYSRTLEGKNASAVHEDIAMEAHTEYPLVAAD